MRWNELGQLTKVLYENDMARLKELARQENLLRSRLRDMEQQSRDCSDVSTQNGAMRAIGADVAWQNWVSRRRVELNLELSNLLVQKARLLEKLQKTFGRNQTVSVLAEKTRAEEKQKQEAKRLDGLQSQFSMRSLNP